MPPRRDPLKEAFQAIAAIAAEGQSDDGVLKLKTVLLTGNGMVVSRTAPVIADWFETSLAEDLVTCFYRLAEKGRERDSQCWGKTAIVKALNTLSWQDTSLYAEACKLKQFEPVRGGQEDTAAALRTAALQALIEAPILNSGRLMTALADLLADDNKRVRAEAARLAAFAPPNMTAPLLRLKIQLGDNDSRVLGYCFDALLSVAPNLDSIDLIHSFTLTNSSPLYSEALASLASSASPEAILRVTQDYSRITDPQLRRILLTSMGASSTQEATHFLLEQLIEPLPEAGWALEALKPKLHDEDLKEDVIDRLNFRQDRLIEQIHSL